MNPLFLSPLLAISMSGAAMFSTAQVALPTSSPQAADPRVLLNQEFSRLEALLAQLQAVQREAERPAQNAAAAAAAPAAPTVARPIAPTGPHATLLATVRLQPASGLHSAAHGLTPESAWRTTFPRKNGR